MNDEVVSALLQSDPDALTRLLADDYRYVSDVGLTLNKLEVLALIRTGNLSYEQLTTMDPKIEVNKEVTRADLTGRASSKGQLRRQPFTDLAFYSNTFQKRAAVGNWFQKPCGTVNEPPVSQLRRRPTPVKFRP